MNYFPEYTGTSVTTVLFMLVMTINIIEVKKTLREKTPWALFLFLLSIFIVLLPLTFTITLIFVIYRELVRYLLKLKYGPNFGGLLGGFDATHTLDEPKNSIISNLMIVEYDHNRNSEDFFDTFKQTISNFFLLHHEAFPKLKSIFLKSMGYSYTLKGNFNADECVRMIEIAETQEEMDKNELMELLSERCNWPLPKNNTILWDMLVNTRPVRWKKNAKDGVKYYAVLTRIHHGVADGVALIKLSAGVLADNQNIKLVSSEKYYEKLEINSNAPERINNESKLPPKNFADNFKTTRTRIIKLLENIGIGFYVLFASPSSLFVNFIMRAKDSNILQGPPLTRQEILVSKVEESPEYIEKIKRIKRRIPGTSFPEILLTAYSASLKDYFQKNSTEYPPYISAVLPVVPGSEQLQDIIPGGIHPSEVDFRNDYSILILDFPLFLKNENGQDKRTPVMDRLRRLKSEINILKNSVDYYVNYLLMSIICPIFPLPIIRYILRTLHCTTILSILPGPSKISYGEGKLPITDFVFWVPHLKNIGVTFSILSYDKRLQVALGADTGLIKHREGAQSIVDGVFKYIDLLEEEIESLNK